MAMCGRRALRSVVHVIEVSHLTKRFGRTTAVDDVSFRVEPGHVTGFLGPNGAGKSTTMRMVLGLDRPTSGRALVDGRPYAELAAPLRSVGAMLDSRASTPVAPPAPTCARSPTPTACPAPGSRRSWSSPGSPPWPGAAPAPSRSAWASASASRRRCSGDPGTVLLDEPVNGLDPEGVLWIRSLTRRMADEGRAVLVSSHLMSEVAQTADHLVVLGAGRVLADAPLHEVIGATGGADRPGRLGRPRRASSAPLAAAGGVDHRVRARTGPRSTGLDAGRVAAHRRRRRASCSPS